MKKTFSEKSKLFQKKSSSNYISSRRAQRPSQSKLYDRSSGGGSANSVKFVTTLFGKKVVNLKKNSIFFDGK